MVNPIARKTLFRPVLKAGIALATVLALFAGFVFPAYAASGLVLTVVGLQDNSLVEIQVDNLPVGMDFTVTESAAGNAGMGPVIAHFNSGTGGTQAYWFEILADVRMNSSAEIRVDNGLGMAAYTTFNPNSLTAANSTTVGATTTIPVTGSTAPSSIVSNQIKVLHVEQGGWVMAQIDNLPLDTLFTVTVGAGGTQGVGGLKVGDLPTEGLSSHVSTFEIPVDLASNSSLDLRLDAPGYVYVVTFNNVNQ